MALSFGGLAHGMDPVRGVKERPPTYASSGLRAPTVDLPEVNSISRRALFT